MDEAWEREAREAMVRLQIEARGVKDPAVLAAMRAVPRHCFAPAEYRALAHEDHPVPLSPGATLSQPYIVAAMLEALDVRPGQKVLEVGSGSGYVLALLAELGAQACGIELDPALAAHSRAVLQSLGFAVPVRCGDGAEGWPEEAPFDALLLSCAAPGVPALLAAQLREGARIVMPEGGAWGCQALVVRKAGDPDFREELMGVAFVPLRSRAKDYQ